VWVRLGRLQRCGLCSARGRGDWATRAGLDLVRERDQAGCGHFPDAAPRPGGGQAVDAPGRGPDTYRIRPSGPTRICRFGPMVPTGAEGPVGGEVVDGANDHRLARIHTWSSSQPPALGATVGRAASQASVPCYSVRCSRCTLNPVTSLAKGSPLCGQASISQRLLGERACSSTSRSAPGETRCPQQCS
jgi:hypothetical protein